MQIYIIASCCRNVGTGNREVSHELNPETIDNHIQSWISFTNCPFREFSGPNRRIRDSPCFRMSSIVSTNMHSFRKTFTYVLAFAPAIFNQLEISSSDKDANTLHSTQHKPRSVSAAPKHHLALETRLCWILVQL